MSSVNDVVTLTEASFYVNLPLSFTLIFLEYLLGALCHLWQEYYIMKLKETHGLGHFKFIVGQDTEIH